MRQREDCRAQLRAGADRAAARRALLLGRRSQGVARGADRAAEDDPVPQEARQLFREVAARRDARAVDCAEPLAVAALADAAAAAGRLAKADLATEMVAELTELQGVMGGIYAREEGQPERVWKAIYLPLSAGRGRRRCAADAAAAGRRGRHLGGGVAGGQARYGRRHVLRRREADGLARSRSDCGGRRTGFSRSSSICRN